MDGDRVVSLAEQGPLLIAQRKFFIAEKGAARLQQELAVDVDLDISVVPAAQDQPGRLLGQLDGTAEP